jgi:hypothetical protein
MVTEEQENIAKKVLDAAFEVHSQFLYKGTKVVVNDLTSFTFSTWRL